MTITKKTSPKTTGVIIAGAKSNERLKNRHQGDDAVSIKITMHRLALLWQGEYYYSYTWRYLLLLQPKVYYATA